MPEKLSSRSRMIDAGAQLFQRKGYHGTGLIEILEQSRAPKGSFYHHFPDGKEQLAEAAIEQARDSVGHSIDAAFADAHSFNDGATNLVLAIADWFERSDYAEGCPITSVLLETVPGSDRLATACKTAFDTWIDKAEGHARRIGGVTRSDSAAMALLIALEGAWVIARVTRSRLPFDVAGAMVVGFIECGLSPE